MDKEIVFHHGEGCKQVQASLEPKNVSIRYQVTLAAEFVFISKGIRRVETIFSVETLRL